MKNRKTLSISVLARALSKQDLTDLLTLYENSLDKRGGGRNVYRPTPDEITLFERWIEGKLDTKQFAALTNVTLSAARNRLHTMSTMRLKGEI